MTASRRGRSRRQLVALLLPLLAVYAGCSEERTVEVATDAPQLALVQATPGTVDIQISGRYALRALQAEVVYDPQRLTITKVEAGPAAARLDRLFFADPAQAQGRLVVGLSDTRRVRLPARGSLIRLHLQAAAGASSATVELKQALGASDGAAAVPLAPVKSEVTL